MSMAQRSVGGGRMDEEIYIRERLVKLETQLETQRQKLDAIERDVKELVEIMQQAKGARWLVLLMATLGGAFITYGSKLIGIMPR